MPLINLMSIKDKKSDLQALSCQRKLILNCGDIFIARTQTLQFRTNILEVRKVIIAPEII